MSVLHPMEQAHVVAEGTRAINLAALNEVFKQKSRPFQNKKVVLLVCGGNIDTSLVDRIIEKYLIESKRFIKGIVQISS